MPSGVKQPWAGSLGSGSDFAPFLQVTINSLHLHTFTQLCDCCRWLACLRLTWRLDFNKNTVNITRIMTILIGCLVSVRTILFFFLVFWFFLYCYLCVLCMCIRWSWFHSSSYDSSTLVLLLVSPMNLKFVFWIRFKTDFHLYHLIGVVLPYI